MSFFVMEGGNDCPYGLLHPQDPPVLDEGSSFSDLHQYSLYPQAYFTGVHLSLEPSSIEGIDRGRTDHLGSVLPPSTLRGHEGVLPAPIKDPTYIKLADIDTSYNSRKDDTRQNFTVSSTPMRISKMKRTTVSLQPVGQPAGMREAPEHPYSCDTCGEKYSQRQGVLRHRREAHNNPHSCLYCDFKWSRPGQYRTHLKKCHPDVNRDYVLGKPAGSRRRSMIIGRDLPHHSYHPVIKLDRRSQAEPWQCPMAPSLPAMTKVIHLPSPAAKLPVAYDSLPEYAEPAITPRELEDAHSSDFLYRQFRLPARSGMPTAANRPTSAPANSY